jgi:nicotinamide-nucleotide amidase
MENKMVEFSAYLFPATVSETEKKLLGEIFPEGTTLTAKLSENGVEIAVKTSDEEKTKALLTGLFGSTLYSFDTADFAEIIVKKLIDKNKKISVAESCTGGLLSKRITDVRARVRFLNLDLPFILTKQRQKFWEFPRKL